MAELKVASLFEFEKVLQGHSNKLFYSKSEVDKVIAEQKERYFELQDTAIKIDEELTETKRQLRHQKYKRCMAMAKWCESTALWCHQAACTLPAGFHATLHGKPVMIEPSRLFKRSALLTKWRERWYKIADNFRRKP